MSNPLSLEYRIIKFICDRLPRVRGFGCIATWLGRFYVRKRRPDLECDVLGARMWLSPHECVDRALMLSPHLYDWRELEYVRRNIEADGVFIDAGANIGFYSLMISKMVPRGRVYAIEASPATYGRLCRNITRNSADNVVAVNVGISDRKEVLVMAQQKDSLDMNSGGNSFVYDGGGDCINVDCVSLLEFVNERGVGRISGLKLDTEGFENKILRHYFSNGGVPPKVIILEQHPWDCERFGDVVSYLCQVGYRVAFKTRGNNYVLAYGV